MKLSRTRGVATPPSSVWILTLLVPPLLGLLGLALGKDADWDFQNYHYYNPFALLNDRLHQDIAVGHHATYYNPVPDLPLYGLIDLLSARELGWVLATIHGLNFTLLLWLGWYLFTALAPRPRLLLAAALALAGSLGGGALTELGGTSNDNLIGLFLLAGLLVLIRYQTQVFQASGGLVVVGLAGLLVGSAAGIKLVAVIYAVGFTMAFLFLPLPFRRRIHLILTFGLGEIAGLLLFAGPWMLILWRETGTPLFPYFNDLFQSPLISPTSQRDLNFIPDSLVERLFFPFYFSFDSFKVAEFAFRDMHILIAFVLIPLAALFTLVQRPASDSGWTSGLPGRYLMLGGGLSYLVWLALFCIYRYLIPLEMLAPLLIAIAVGMLPFTERTRLITLAALLVIAQLLAYPDTQRRQAWGNHYLEVGVPPLATEVPRLVVMAGTSPLAYLIPHFPSRSHFLRLDGYLVSSQERDAGLAQRMRARLEHHPGPVHALYQPHERESLIQALTAYGLELVDSTCQPVTSSIAEDPLLCTVNAVRPLGE